MANSNNNTSENTMTTAKNILIKIFLGLAAVSPALAVNAQQLIIRPSNVVLVPEVPQEVRILSLNNSLIDFNRQNRIFNNIAEAMGKDANWTMHTILGQPLSYHWNEGDNNGLGAKSMVSSEPWTHIILQEQSILPRLSPTTFRSSVRRWVNYIRRSCPNPDAVIIIPVNWAYSSDWDHFVEYNDEFTQIYEDVAYETGVTICPINKAYRDAYIRGGEKAVSPWFSDDRHPTMQASYMAACMEYGLIYGENPLDISWHPDNISEDVAREMRTAAAAALQTYVNPIDHRAATIRYSAKLTDAAGKIVENPNVTFRSDGGQISADGVFTCSEPGTYTVTAECDGLSEESIVKVAGVNSHTPGGVINPATKKIISYTGDNISAQGAHLTLINGNGIIMERSHDMLSLTAYPAGLYIVTASYADTMQTLKIIRH